MINFSKNDAYSIQILMGISLTSVLFPNDLMKRYAELFFLLHTSVIFFSIYRDRYLLLFLDPLILTLFYINTSLMIGAFAYNNGYVLLNTSNYYDYLSWDYLNNSVFYILLCNTVLFSINSMYKRQVIEYLCDFTLNKNKVNPAYCICSLAISIPFIFIPLDLSVLGGSGDLSIIPFTISALLWIYYLSKNKIKWRLAAYLGIIIMFSAFSIDSKREAIFLLLPIFFLEAFFNKIKVTKKIILISIITSILLVILISAMSIARGYGQFIENNSLIDSLPFLYDYFSSPIYLSSLFNNIEVNYTFFHSMQAIEYIQHNIQLLSYGSTIFKSLFILIPRSIWEGKPDSIIDLYTTYHDPLFRLIGGSWPVNIYAEFFWNFYFFGFLFLAPFFWLYAWFYIKLIRGIISERIMLTACGLFIYMNFLTYVRGSGLDMYLVYAILAGAYSLLVWAVSNIFIRNNLR